MKYLVKIIGELDVDDGVSTEDEVKAHIAKALNDIGVKTESEDVTLAVGQK